MDKGLPLIIGCFKAAYECFAPSLDPENRTKDHRIMAGN
jgi:hypothetical protein